MIARYLNRIPDLDSTLIIRIEKQVPGGKRVPGLDSRFIIRIKKQVPGGNSISDACQHSIPISTDSAAFEPSEFDNERYYCTSVTPFKPFEFDDGL